MVVEIAVGKRKLVINQDYLARFRTEEELYRTLDKDLIDVRNGGEVHLIRPTESELNPLFADVLSHVCARAIRGNYTMMPTNDYDADKIRAILGGNVVGDLQQGYRLQRKG